VIFLLMKSRTLPRHHLIMLPCTIHTADILMTYFHRTSLKST